MRIVVSRFLAVLAICMPLVAHPALAAEAARGPLVDAGWLQRNLGDPGLVVLDASPAQLYKAQHIPGAIGADLMSYGVEDAPVARMEQRFQSWGLARGKKVVVYDQGGTFWATRLFYDLHYHGFPAEDILVLDGGMARWRASGGAVTAEPTPAPPRGTFRIAKLNEDARVRLPEFLVGSGDPANHALVEALEPSWHFGETMFFDRAGHIPSGIMLPSGDFFREDKTFKSPQELRRMLDYLGIRPEQQVYAYCGGGVAASVPYFALRYLLGYPKVRLYQGSELEWLRDDRGLPKWTYDAPYLLRETAWLKTWGGRMLRSYGVSHVSIVDVRPAEAFARGHMPFALSVPAEVFRAHLRDPQRLAEILARAGVDASHEAVVVSDAGLDPAAALAYVMLERAGQKRVSVFVDSLDGWLEGGQELTKVAAPAPARTTSFPAPRTGTVIGEAKAAQGAYPTLLVASGQRVPASLPEGRVVHVPYTELLDARGRPKPAKDIWNLLAKAGVPRYAHLVTFAEDPGEAAANYLVLKLMGWPDVKVLVP